MFFVYDTQWYLFAKVTLIIFFMVIQRWCKYIIPCSTNASFLIPFCWSASPPPFPWGRGSPSQFVPAVKILHRIIRFYYCVNFQSAYLMDHFTCYVLSPIINELSSCTNVTISSDFLHVKWNQTKETFPCNKINKSRSVRLHLLLYVTTIKSLNQVGTSCNASDLYTRGARFESRARKLFFVILQNKWLVTNSA
jgi:hypothetical protein